MPGAGLGHAGSGKGAQGIQNQQTELPYLLGRTLENRAGHLALFLVASPFYPPQMPTLRVNHRLSGPARVRATTTLPQLQV